MSRTVCGICWCPYDEDTGACGCPAPLKAALAEPVAWTDADADAARLAMELECLLLATKDTAALSRWWGSAHDALELHRQRLGEPSLGLNTISASCAASGCNAPEGECLGVCRGRAGYGPGSLPFQYEQPEEGYEVGPSGKFIG